MLATFSYVDFQRQNCAVGEDVEKLKQRLSLLDYLRQQNWAVRAAGHGPEFVGLCPLHPETRPSFYVNARKNLFYCHGCGQGGDLIRFVQLFRHLSFRESLAHLEQQSAPPTDPAAILEQAATFYQQQLHCYAEALRYLEQRGLRDPALIKELRIGYAPGGSLRRHLTAQGYSCDLLQRLGLLNSQDHDAFHRRVIFPCCQGGRIVNLYGRSIAAAFAHRFLPGSRGGLYAWESVRQFPTVILVEGLFDFAVLWQMGFRHATCSLGTHLNAEQFQQLCDRPRTVYLTFDVDANGSGQKATVPISPGGCSTMKFRLIHQQTPNSAQSPVRVVEQTTGRGVSWINRYLDREYVRRLANTSLRTYAHNLLHFVRWWESIHYAGDIREGDLTESTLLDYVRFQSSQQPRPSPSTINDRVAVADRAIRNEFPNAPCQIARGFHQAFLQRKPMGLGRPWAAMSRLRVKVPKRNIVPLSVEEVARFWSSFRTSRDLAIVGLMLLQGLRSAEVLALNRDDALLSEAQLRVPGKGNKFRSLPLAPETVQLLEHYLRLERPNPCSAALFVSLKGHARGTRMTAAGLRSLFRYHRQATGIQLANPHRFRHYSVSRTITE